MLHFKRGAISEHGGRKGKISCVWTRCNSLFAVRVDTKWRHDAVSYFITDYHQELLCSV